MEMQNELHSNTTYTKTIVTSKMIEDGDINDKKIWYDDQYGVRKAGVIFALTDFELEEYEKCKIDIHYFAEKYCKIKRDDGIVGNIILRDFQNKMLDIYTNNRFSILMSSRQMGKTVAASIVLLHYCLFNNNKNVMIVANRGKTVEDIIYKIKGIYKLLPFFIKKGVNTWNERSICFENGCQILTERRIKSPSIGFNIDFLYFDEFAKVPQNIIKNYYYNIVPSILSKENTRIIITSTPEGHNLFYKLFSDAEREDGDPLKNQYKALRVYWYERKDRLDTKLISKLHSNRYVEISEDDIISKLKSDYSFEIVKKGEGIYFIKRNENENTDIEYINKIKIDGIDLSNMFKITNWRKEETMLLGSEEMFKQVHCLDFNI